MGSSKKGMYSPSFRLFLFLSPVSASFRRELVFRIKHPCLPWKISKYKCPLPPTLGSPRLFNFLVKNFSLDRSKPVIQGTANAPIPKKTSPSAWEDRESQVQVPVSKKAAQAGLVLPTVVTVERPATVPMASGKRREDSTASKDQDGGTTSVKPRKKTITIWGGTELTEEKDVKDELGKKAPMEEQGKAGKTEASDINVQCFEFIRWKRNSLNSNEETGPNSSSP